MVNLEFTLSHDVVGMFNETEKWLYEYYKLHCQLYYLYCDLELELDVSEFQTHLLLGSEELNYL